MNSLLSRYKDVYLLKVLKLSDDINKDPQETSDIQVELKIVFELCEASVRCSDDGSQSIGDIAIKSRHKRSCAFDLCNFSNQVQAFHTTLSEILSTFIVDGNIINRYIKIIVALGHKIIDRECKIGTKVIPLLVKLRRVQHVIDIENYERFLLHMAARVSMEEFERRNYGRVPASESSMKTLMKMVRVEGASGDDNEKQESKRRCVSESQINCSICLEQLWVGTYGMAMPCSHVFHADCIMQWLKQSHLCPLCRYVMPADTES